MSRAAPTSFRAGILNQLRQFDGSNMDAWVALRNALGVVVPLGLGLGFGAPTAAMVMGLAALVASYSDGPDPYPQRARRMLASCLLCTVAVVAGAISARSAALAIPLVLGWSFVAGLAVLWEGSAADLGVFSLTMLVIFSAKPLSNHEAALYGALALGGGLWQTALGLLLWPFHRYEPERKELGKLYLNLARLMTTPVRSGELPPAGTQSLRVQRLLAGMTRDHGPEPDRFRSLLSQAERVRLRMVTLARLKRRAEREDLSKPAAETVSRFQGSAARALHSIGRGLLSDGRLEVDPGPFSEMEARIREQREQIPIDRTLLAAMMRDTLKQMEALSAQLRAARFLAAHATVPGDSRQRAREARRPWRLRFVGPLATIRANLTFRSIPFRHAIRLSLCMGVGTAVAAGFGLYRPYWLPMTIAIVLKPEFGGTLSRAFLRIAGTFIGLFLATALFHALPPDPRLLILSEILVLGAFVFFLRWAGVSHYGVFAMMVSAIVVLLLALTGVPPQPVVYARALNTVLGGGIALLASWAWPTWEKTRLPEVFARLLDTYREYFAAVVLTSRAGAAGLPGDPGSDGAEGTVPSELDRLRIRSRVARANLYTSARRLETEPGFSRAERVLLGAMQSTSNRFAHAVMALEAGGSLELPEETARVFDLFSSEVVQTLRLLSEKLAGAPVARKSFPDLRASCARLIELDQAAIDSHGLLQNEADRITNSLNTLQEQILRWSELRRESREKK